jgi:predicted house-cleaning NTP pyrophosphatase (Maf/HAM1 superfamily)
VFNGRLLEKPATEAEVYGMLSGLSGVPHGVITGAAIGGLSEGAVNAFYESVAQSTKRLSAWGNGIELYRAAALLGTKNDSAAVTDNISDCAAAKTDTINGNPTAKTDTINGGAAATYNTIVFSCLSRVLFTKITPETIKETLEKENPYACSGGYTVTGVLKPYFRILSGTVENVIGLPVQEILSVLSVIK